MPIDNILDLAKQVNSAITQKDIAELSGGYSSVAYKINVQGSPFVLLVERPGGVTKSNYGHAYVCLKLLEKHKIGHAPLPLWLNKDHSAIAISYFDGIASDKIDYENLHIDTLKLALDVIDTIQESSVITIDEYNELATKLDVMPAEIETTQDSARKSGTEWFEIVKKSCPDQKIVNWLEPKIKLMVRLANELDNKTLRFGLGDASNPNILVNKDGKFMLIDWDSATFNTSGPEGYIAYTTELTDFMKPHRESIIKHVSYKLGINEAELSNKVNEYLRFNGIGDINWAAMMMAKVNSGEISDDIEHFRMIALQRISSYEKTFDTK